MFESTRLKLLSKLRDVFRRLSNRLSDRQMLALLAIVVGLLAGLGTCVFEMLLHGVKSALVAWFPSDRAQALLLIYPAIGIILATLFVKRIAHISGKLALFERKLAELNARGRAGCKGGIKRSLELVGTETAKILSGILVRDVACDRAVEEYRIGYLKGILTEIAYIKRGLVIGIVVGHGSGSAEFIIYDLFGVYVVDSLRRARVATEGEAVSDALE